MVNLTDMPTLLRYGIETYPFPLQASPDTGDLVTAQLTITAFNPNTDPKNNPVSVQGVIITLPVGETANDLTPDASTINPAPPPGWNPPDLKTPPGFASYVFHPTSGGSASIGIERLDFIFNNIQINRVKGSVDVVVTEGSGDCDPPDCPTQTCLLSKFPSGWGQVTFTVKDPIIPYGSGTTLSWDGPAEATYTIQYLIPPKDIVSIPQTGQEPLACRGQYSVVLNQTSAFTLNVEETIEDTPYHAQAQVTVTVEPPTPLSPPTITQFTGTIQTVGGKQMLKFQWAASHANYCTLSAVPTEKLALSGGYQIPLLPLEETYTLTAMRDSDSATATSTLNLKWTVTDSIPGWSTNALDIAISPDGSRLYVVNEGQITVFKTASESRYPSNLGITSWPYSSTVYVICTAIAISPDGTRLYVAYNVIEASSPTGYIVMCDASTLEQINWGTKLPDKSTIYSIAVWPDNSQIYLADPTTNTVSVFNVVMLDDPTYPLKSAGSLPNASSTEVRVSPDGSHLYVLSTDSIQAYLPTNDPSKPLRLTNSYTWGDSVHASSLGFAPGISYPAALMSNWGEVILFDASTMNIADQASHPVAAFLSREWSGLVAVAPDGSCVYVAYEEADESGRTICKLVPSYQGAT